MKRGRRYDEVFNRLIKKSKSPVKTGLFVTMQAVKISYLKDNHRIETGLEPPDVELFPQQVLL
jgi:hypothetical protein